MTESNRWTTVGGSIVENTRSEWVERIYLLFGNLGNTPPMFRCKPYQACLSNIVVTHSPRYLIDMRLTEEENILCKLGVDYDAFRVLSEQDKVQRVRNYFIEKAKKNTKLKCLGGWG